MFKNFNEIVEKAVAKGGKAKIAICGADDEKMIHVALEAIKLGLCRVLMVGDREKIISLLGGDSDNEDIEILDEKDRVKSCLVAVEQVSSGKAQVFVKGNVNTNDFLRAVLNKEVGLRSGRKLNVLSCYEIPSQPKLLFLADGGMMVAPVLQDKIDIVNNCVPVLQNMGIEEPKVAILAANEQVSPDIPATADADVIVKMAEKGELPKAIYEGPMALDVIMRKEAAKVKGIVSRVSGEADFILVPNIETGNTLGKAIGYFGKASMAGIVVGANKPVIMASRAASIKSKITSIAWALLACQE